MPYCTKRGGEKSTVNCNTNSKYYDIYLLLFLYINLIAFIQ